jgi:GNAT superfamily N-acetyltransferase
MAPISSGVMAENDTWTVRFANPDDRDQCRALYRGYRDFYEMPADDAKIDTVWGWIADSRHEVNGLVAVNGRGELGGLANIRRFARPLTASTGLFLDDLYTRPELRGQGLGRLLLDFLGDYAAANNLSVVRWITAESNTQARALYDRNATATSWVTYDKAPHRA